MGVTRKQNKQKTDQMVIVGKKVGEDFLFVKLKRYSAPIKFCNGTNHFAHHFDGSFSGCVAHQCYNVGIAGHNRAQVLES